MTRIIGIDPGVATGVAMLEDGRFTEFRCLGFWEAYELVRQCSSRTTVVIEIAADTYVWQPNARSRAGLGKALKVAQDVGAVRREGLLLAQGLQRSGLQVVTRPPRGKVDARRFAEITGYRGRMNQHKRDAGMLAWYEYQSMLTGFAPF